MENFASNRAAMSVRAFGQRRRTAALPAGCLAAETLRRQRTESHQKPLRTGTVWAGGSPGRCEPPPTACLLRQREPDGFPAASAGAAAGTGLDPQDREVARGGEGEQIIALE